MTRYTLLNNALARGQIAGGRAAAARQPRSVTERLCRSWLGPHAADPDVRNQFARGFALGYDTGGLRTGFFDDVQSLASDVKDAATKAATTARPPAPPPSSTVVYSPPPTPTTTKPPPTFQAPVKAGLFGLSRNATIALGVGTAVAVGGAIYFGTRKD